MQHSKSLSLKRQDKKFIIFLQWSGLHLQIVLISEKMKYWFQTQTISSQ